MVAGSRTPANPTLFDYLKAAREGKLDDFRTSRAVPAVERGEHAPFVAGSVTSAASAQEIKPAIRDMRERVYAALATRPSDGMTDEEGADATDLGGSTYRPRRIELIAEGRVEDSGMRRKTKSGRRATVWIVTRARLA